VSDTDHLLSLYRSRGVVSVRTGFRAAECTASLGGLRVPPRSGLLRATAQHSPTLTLTLTLTQCSAAKEVQLGSAGELLVW
jgi:hypothetical protein